MRNPDRIAPTLELVRKIWERYPDLRLGQLIGNCGVHGDAYHLEEDALVAKLTELYDLKAPSPAL